MGSQFLLPDYTSIIQTPVAWLHLYHIVPATVAAPLLWPLAVLPPPDSTSILLSCTAPVRLRMPRLPCLLACVRLACVTLYASVRLCVPLYALYASHVCLLMPCVRIPCLLALVPCLLSVPWKPLLPAAAPGGQEGAWAK